jgi:hypothetical protein
MRSLDFSVTLFFQLHYGPGVYSASNRSKYQKMFLGVKSDRHVRLTTSSPSVSRLSRRCDIPYMSQPYKPPRPVIGTDPHFSLFSFTNIFLYGIRLSERLNWGTASTERRGAMFGIRDLHSGGAYFKCRQRDLPNWVHSWFSTISVGKSRMVHYIRPLPPTSASSMLQYLLILL